MNKFLNKLEKLIRPFAIPNITVGIIAIQVVVYVLSLSRPTFAVNLMLWRDSVLNGEIWRLVTFLFLPPQTILLFLLFFWMLLYQFGTTLENQWGIARYNLFLLIGYLATVTVAMAVPGSMVDNSFLYGTVFLAFAHLYPEFTLNVLLVLPVQVRWLALLMWVGFAWQFVSGDWSTRVAVTASVLNFLLFFGPSMVERLRRGRIHRQRKSSLEKQARKPRHTCSVCGVTNLSDPSREFRYCSKCDGDLCYCLEHLESHVHAKEKASP